MKKTKTSDQGPSVEDLQKQIRELTEQNARAVSLWREEAQKATKAMGDAFSVARLTKQMAVIEHITAGRHDEAIQEILKPLPILFNVDVQYADDKTRIAAVEEMLEKVKKLACESIAGITIEPSWDEV